MTEMQNLVLQNRAALSVTGVTEVRGFDEHSISIETSMGDLLVKGKSLHVARLSLDLGEVDIEGTVNSLEYTKQRRNRETFLARVFK